LNIDVSHSFIACRGDNGKLQQILELTDNYAKYYHLVDSMGIQHDSLPLGHGKIDWSMVKPYVIDKDFIFEIKLKGDHSDCTPMIDSVKYFNEIEYFVRKDV
jgi:sugar phosphate isomerase/epimerase